MPRASLALLAGCLACNSATTNGNHHDSEQCNGVTTDITSDPANCGTCGNACGGTTPGCCNSNCVDLAIDSNNCGQCATACDQDGGACCSDGNCFQTQLTADPANCGACGVSCGVHLCVEATCQSQVTCNIDSDCPEDGGGAPSCVPDQQDGPPFFCDDFHQGNIFQGCTGACTQTGVSCWATLDDAGDTLRSYCTTNCSTDKDCYDGNIALGLGFCCTTDYGDGGSEEDFTGDMTYQCLDPSCMTQPGACVPCF